MGQGSGKAEGERRLKRYTPEQRRHAVTHRDEYFYSADSALAAAQIVEAQRGRWTCFSRDPYAPGAGAAAHRKRPDLDAPMHLL